jgi:hypothetical protein
VLGRALVTKGIGKQLLRKRSKKVEIFGKTLEYLCLPLKGKGREDVFLGEY